MRLIFRRFLHPGLVAALTFGPVALTNCTDLHETPTAEKPLPASEAATVPLLSTHGRRGLARAPSKPETPQDPRVPADLQELLAAGFGQTVRLPGEPHEHLTPDASPAPQPGSGRRRLASFLHLADTQLSDDESPSRVCNVDQPIVAAGFRPQDGYGCHLLDAAVRTANAIARQVAVDFLVLGGDNADSAQRNEVKWFGQVLGGGMVECDSGADDGDLPGLPFPQKKPFQAEGLQVPWYWVSGNHDVLVMGNWAVDADRMATAVGSYASGGTRDYRLPGAPVTDGDVPADPERAALLPAHLVDVVKSLPTGAGPPMHGLAAMQPGQTHITYRATPGKGRPLDLIVVDSTAHTGSASGLVRRPQFEAEIRPALEASRKAGHWAIVAAHYASWQLTNGGKIFGTEQPDAMTADEYLAEVSAYPNVLFLLAGHSHRNHLRAHLPGKTAAKRPIWEVQTASIVDWPSQMRLVEVFDEDTNWLSARLTVFDTAVELAPGQATNALIAQAIALVTLDKTSGWNSGTGDGDSADRNVVLWVPKAAGFTAAAW